MSLSAISIIITNLSINPQVEVNLQNHVEAKIVYITHAFHTSRVYYQLRPSPTKLSGPVSGVCAVKVCQ